MGNQARTIGVVGTGMIASSMAVLITGHGLGCVVLARSDASAQRCEDTYREHWRELVAHGVATEAQAERCHALLHVTQDYAQLAGCEAVFECAVEDVDVKHDIYRRIRESVPDVRAVCSASSSIVPDVLAQGCGALAGRIVVTHPFNPAHMVPFFEVCQGEGTDPGVVDYVVGLLEELDRKPVVLKRPTPGFIGNRLQFALWREAVALVEEGVCDPRDVDTALEYGWAPRYTSIGIFEHFDNGGMDLNSRTCANLFPVLSDRKDVPPSIRRLLETGRTGAKAGEGFYDWRDVDMEAYAERVNAPYWKFCHWKYLEE